jgi:hypothetical protein
MGLVHMCSLQDMNLTNRIVAEEFEKGCYNLGTILYLPYTQGVVDFAVSFEATPIRKRYIVKMCFLKY